jgi:hypothetical protein
VVLYIRSKNFLITYLKKGKQMKDFDYCQICGDKLKVVRIVRRVPRTCYMCRGDRVSGSKALRELFAELQKKPAPVDEDGAMFEDDPRALKENDIERYVSKPFEASYGVSEIASMASRGSNYAKYKRNSSIDEKQHTQKKG